MKNQHFQVFKDNEEARRIAVEAALSELLARDTQYRKELKAHLETRLENAEARRNMLISIIRKVSDVAKDVLRDIFCNFGFVTTIFLEICATQLQKCGETSETAVTCNSKTLITC